MILISNHLLSSIIPFPKDAIVRINIAWIKNTKELGKALDIPYGVCIDYPEGRTKPPTATISFYDVLQVIKRFNNVKYLAVSNIESGNIAALFRESLPEGVSFIPKIETKIGIDNFDDIQEQSLPEYIMLDTEDLFVDVGGDAGLFNSFVKRLKEKCDIYKVKILNLAGVVFSD